MYRISQTRRLSAVHFIRGSDARDHYKKMHGHSWDVTVHCHGTRNDEMGWVLDLEALDAALAQVLDQLSDRILNEIDGLEKPTMENMAAYIFDHISAQGYPVSEIEICRPTLGQAVTYYGPA